MLVTNRVNISPPVPPQMRLCATPPAAE